VNYRSLTVADLDEVRAIEARAYLAALLVSDDAFLRLMQLFPDGAIGAFDPRGLCGYAFGVPLVSGTTLDLRAPLAEIPAAADVFYVHDVAVAARCRGRGIGTALATRLLDVARKGRFTRAELVSVQGSHPFWERFGFRTVRQFDYAPGAPSRFMVAELERPQR
jgi:GNAT superfamily N-acetyltransferase